MPGNPQRLSAGQRDRLITIEQCVDTVGPSQFPIETWTTLIAGVHAAYDDESGGETFAAPQLSATDQVRWTIPYRADCDPEVIDVAKRRRVVANGRIYDILAANPIGRRAGIELRTRAKVG